MIQTDNIHNIVKSGNKRKNTCNNFFSKNLLIFAGTTEGRQLIEYLINYTDIIITACYCNRIWKNTASCIRTSINNFKKT